MRNRVAYAMALCAFTAASPLLAEENLKPPARVSNTEHLDFAPGGTIRVNGSYDDLYIEGWDEPQVEMTVTKFMPFEYDAKRGAQHMEEVRVTTERSSASELMISTLLPPHRGLPWHPKAASKTGHVRMEYQLRVPRNSRLVIHHEVGLVSVTDVTGDIEATCHRGDIMLWLPQNGTYAIDARNRLGKVSSDFPGASLAHFLVGQKFSGSAENAPQRLYLRMGFGGITLKPILPESLSAARFVPAK